MSKRKETNIDLTVPPFPPSFPWPCVLVLTVRHGLLSIRGGGAWGNKYLGKAAILRQFIPGCLRSDPPEARFNCRRDVHTWDFKTGLLPCWWLWVICTFGRHWLWTISLTQCGRDLKRDYNGSDWKEAHSRQRRQVAAQRDAYTHLWPPLWAALSGPVSWVHLVVTNKRLLGNLHTYLVD